MYKSIAKHGFWIASVSIAFYFSGMIGLFCESWHSDPWMGSSAFSVSFAGFVAAITKIYAAFSPDLFG